MRVSLAKRAKDFQHFLGIIFFYDYSINNFVCNFSGPHANKKESRFLAFLRLCETIADSMRNCQTTQLPIIEFYSTWYFFQAHNVEFNVSGMDDTLKQCCASAYINNIDYRLLRRWLWWSTCVVFACVHLHRTHILVRWRRE